MAEGQGAAGCSGETAESSSVLLVSGQYATSEDCSSPVSRQVAQTLRGAGRKVYSAVLEDTEEDRKCAEADGVELILPTRSQGDTREPCLAWLTFDHVDRYPNDRLPQDVGWIVGHAGVTSRAAATIKEQRFPQASLSLVTQTIPEDTEKYKEEDKAMGIGEKEDSIRQDAEKADTVFSVGHRTQDHFVNSFRAIPKDKRPNHYLFLPKPSDLFLNTTVEYFETSEKVVLLFGRVTTVERVKGFDLAAKILSKAVERSQDRIKLRIRGVSKEEYQASMGILQTSINSGKLIPTLLPHGTQEDICRDMQQAHLVLMPSRAEPFGLVGLEAMAAGVPVLISDKSGLADLVNKVVPEFCHSILRITGDDSVDVGRWADQIADVLRMSEAEFRRAAELKQKLLESKYWEESHQQFLQAFGGHVAEVQKGKSGATLTGETASDEGSQNHSEPGSPRASSSQLKRKGEDGEEFPGKKKLAPCTEEGSLKPSSSQQKRKRKRKKQLPVKKKATPKQSADVQEYFDKVIKGISYKWDDLAWKLGFGRNEIKGIGTTEPSPDHRCREVLDRWRNRKGREATLQVLKQALIDIDERATAESLEDATVMQQADIMSEAHRTLLLRSYPAISQDLDATKVVDYLHQHQVITDEMRQDILSIPEDQRHRRTWMLLDCIFCSIDSTFNIFCTALEQAGYQHLSQLMKGQQLMPPMPVALAIYLGFRQSGQIDIHTTVPAFKPLLSTTSSRSENHRNFLAKIKQELEKEPLTAHEKDQILELKSKMKKDELDTLYMYQYNQVKSLERAKTMLSQESIENRFDQLLNKVEEREAIIVNTYKDCVILFLTFESQPKFEHCWDLHTSGSLSETLTELLVTEEMRKLEGGDQLVVRTLALEKDYMAWRDFFSRSSQSALVKKGPTTCRQEVISEKDEPFPLKSLEGALPQLEAGLLERGSPRASSSQLKRKGEDGEEFPGKKKAAASRQSDLFQESVKKYYELKLTHFKPLIWNDNFTLSLSDIFTQLELIQKSKHKRSESMREEQRKELKSLDDLFKPDVTGLSTAPRCILIEGEAGGGKTTFLSKEALDAVSQKTELGRRHDIVLLIRLREVREGETIEEMVWDQCVDETTEGIEAQSIRTILQRNKSRVLFLLDGYDELRPEARAAGQAIPKLLSGKMYPNSTIVITSRPSAGVQQYTRPDCHVHITGFSEEHVEEYVQQYFTVVGKQELTKTLAVHVNSNKLLNTLIYTCTPMFLMFVCLLWEEDQEMVSTGTMMGLYGNLLTCLVRKCCKREGVDMPTEGLPTEVAESLLQLGKLALEALLRNETLLDLTEVEREKVNWELLLKLGVVSLEVSSSKLHPRKQLNFSHKTMQEFLAGRYVAHARVNQDIVELLQLTSISKSLELSNLLQFTCGCDSRAAQAVMEELSKLSSREFAHLQPDQFERSNVPKGRDIQKSCQTYERFVNLCLNILSERQEPELLQGISHALPIVMLDSSINSREATGLKYYIQNLHSANLPDRLILKIPRGIDRDKVQYLQQCFPTSLPGLRLDLTLSGQFDSPVLTARLVSVLKNVPCLRVLVLSGTKLTPSSLQPLVQGFRHMSLLLLEELDLSVNPDLGDAGMEVLQVGLSSIPHLAVLRLWEVGMRAVGMLSLAPYMQHLVGLRVLDISDNMIGDTGLESLTTILHTFTAMQVLGLRKTSISFTGMRTLVPALCKLTRLIKLDISSNAIGDPGLECLAAILHHLTAMKVLVLSWTGISDRGISSLIKALPHLVQLQVLNVSYNNIGDSGIVSLVQTLCQPSSLDMEQNPPGDKSLTTAPHYNTTLQELHIGRNRGVTGVGLGRVAQVISTLPALTRLNMSGHLFTPAHLSDTAAMDLAEALPRLPALELLDLEFISMEPAGFQAVVQAAEEHPTLERLWSDVQEYFDKVIKGVSYKWDDLAWKLGFDRNEIKGIGTTEPSPDHRCREVLDRWRNREGREATLQVLKQALIDIDERATAESLEGSPRASSSQLKRKGEDGEEFPGKKKPAPCREEEVPGPVGAAGTESSSVTDLFQESVKKYYELKLTHFKPLIWNDNFTLSLTDIFTQLELIQKSKHTRSESMRGEQRKELKSLELIPTSERNFKTSEKQKWSESMREEQRKELKSLDDLFSQDVTGLSTAPRCILIEGEAGGGKTTFLSKEALDAVSQKTELGRRHNIVLLIRLREVREGETIEEMVWDQCVDETTEGIDVQSIRTILQRNKSRVLFLLDGYDELRPEARAAGQAIPKLLSGKMYPNSTIVITSRPSAGVQQYTRPDCHVHIMGFSPEHAAKHVRKYFSITGSPELAKDFIKQYFTVKPVIDDDEDEDIDEDEDEDIDDDEDEDIDEDEDEDIDDDEDEDIDDDDNSDTQSDDLSTSSHEEEENTTTAVVLKDDKIINNLIQTPIFLVFVCLLWEEDQEMVSTGTMMGLYDNLLTCLVRKCCEREGVDMPTEGLPTEVAESLLQLGKLALEALLRNETLLDLTEVKREKVNWELLLKLGVVSLEDSSSKLHPRKQLNFSHKTMQEFLAGRYVAHAQVNQDIVELLQLTSISKALELSNLLQFTCGCDSQAALAVMEGLSKLSSREFSHLQPEHFERSNVAKDRDLKKSCQTYERFALLCLNILSERQEPKVLQGISQALPIVMLDSSINSREATGLKYYIQNLHSANLPDRLILKIHGDTDSRDIVQYLQQCFKTSLPGLKLDLELSEYGQFEFDSPDLTAKLVSVLKNVPCLRVLGLSHTKLTPSSLQPLVQGFRHMSLLEELDLSRNPDLGDAGMEVLQVGLSSVPHLAVLRLGAVSMTAVGMSSLAPYMRHLVGLRELDINCNEIGDTGLESLTTVLHTFTAMRVLGLAMIGISPTGMRTLVPALCKLTRLIKLHISHNAIGDPGLECLTAILHHLTAMKVLLLSETGISDRGISSLIKALPHLVQLQVLDVRWNNIGDSGIVSLVQTLCQPSSLDMEQNPPGDKSLTTAPHYNTTLQELDIGGNRGVTAAGLGRVAQLISTLPALTKLEMSGYTPAHLSDTAAMDLAKALPRLPALEQLNLWNIFMEPAGFQAVVQAAEEHPTLEWLEYLRSLVPEGADTTASCLDLLDR
ncbi:uncharacterized protein LOC144916387 [Branchiostoma floridae x Branchiostoma belcheri]